MFGNIRGWLISAAILAFTVFLVVFKGMPEAISKPTKKLPAGLVSAAMPTEPRKVIEPGKGDCEAGPLYRKAAAWVKANRKAIDNFDDRKTTGAAKLQAATGMEEGIEILVEASDCSKMNLFSKKPEEVVNYVNNKPVLSELQQLGRIAYTVGVLYAKEQTDGKGKVLGPAKDAEKGNKYLMASFHLGRNLYEERIVFDEYRIGVELMTNAATFLGRYGQKEKADDLEKLKQGGDMKKFEPVYAAIRGIPSEGKSVGLPGDIFDIAMNSKEPMWQTEALLKLGRMQKMIGVRNGDQIGAKRVLRQMSERTDLAPNVKAAAIKGRDMTMEEFNMYGGGA